MRIIGLKVSRRKAFEVHLKVCAFVDVPPSLSKGVSSGRFIRRPVVACGPGCGVGSCGKRPAANQNSI